MQVFVVIYAEDEWDAYPAAIFGTEEAAQEFVALKYRDQWDYTIEAMTVDDSKGTRDRIRTWHEAKILEIEARQEERDRMNPKPRRRPLYDPAYDVRSHQLKEQTEKS